MKPREVAIWLAVLLTVAWCAAVSIAEDAGRRAALEYEHNGRIYYGD